MKNLSLLLCLLLIWSIKLESQCSYPFLPQTDQDRIGGTVGERRSNDRYHYGIDFNLATAGAARNLAVYTIEGGPLFKVSTSGLDAPQIERNSSGTPILDYYGNTIPIIDPATGMQLMSVNHSLSVGNYGYLHIRTDPGIQLMADGTFVAKGTLLGTIEPFGGDINASHLHLQISGNATSIFFESLNSDQIPIPVFQLPGGWEDGAKYNYINPITTLTPLVDNAIRNIDNLFLTRENSSDTNDPAITSDIIYGKYDVVIKSEDYHIETNGTGMRGFNAPHEAYYKIFDDSSKELFKSETIRFDVIPPNSSGPTFFHSTASLSKWVCNLTDNIFMMPYNRFLNTRRSKNSADILISTDVPDNAEFPDGEEIYFEARTTDFMGNSALRTLPVSAGSATAPTDFFTLDNFWPYISAVSVSQDGSDIASLNRLSSEGVMNVENDGYIMNSTGTGDSDDFIQNSNIAFTVSFSESMEDVDFNVNVQHISAGISSVPGTDEKIWAGNFTMDIGVAQEIQISFVGNDRSGNELIDIYDLTSSNTVGPQVPIPTRTDVTTNINGWINFPSSAGLDAIDIIFGCTIPGITDNGDDSQNRSLNGNVNCDFIVNPSFFIQHASCAGKGKIIINYELGAFPIEVIEFYNSGGDLVSSGTGIAKDLDPGIYTYLIQDGCCIAEGSIEILGPELPEYTATFSEGISPDGGVDVELIVDIPEQLAPVVLEITNINTGMFCGRLLSAGENQIVQCFGFTGGDEYCIEFMWGENCSLTECLIAPVDSCPDDLYVVDAAVIPSCPNIDNGSIILDIESGNCGSLSILWDNGATGGTLDGLASGTYCVTISATCNGVDCESISCYEVEELSPALNECQCPPILIESNVVDICIVSFVGPVYIRRIIQNGSISINVIQGGGGYTFDWGDGNATDVAYREFSTTGEKCVTITDACGSSRFVCFIVESMQSSGFCFTASFPLLGNLQAGFDEIEAQWNDLPGSVEIDESFDAELDISSNAKAKYKLKQNDLPDDKGFLIIEKNQNKIKGNANTSFENEVKAVVDNKVNLYPNPFSDFFNLEFESDIDQELTISIFDLSGRLVKESALVNISKGVNNVKVQDIAHLIDGLYIVQLSSSTIKENIQVVKMTK